MTWNFQIENISGIREGSATIEPGTNVVRASNFQGKSSFITAIETALGVSAALTEGADHGAVQYQTQDREDTVELRPNGETVELVGEPYFSDEYDVVRAELYACLGETNPVRQAVRDGKNLKDVLLRPLDFENIDEQIQNCKREREQIESELTQASEAKRQLPSAKEKVERLENELEELRGKHEELLARSDADGPSESSTQNELAQARSEREQTANRIERLQRTIERTESSLEEKREELHSIEEPADDVEEELSAAREQLQELKRDRTVLESLYSATEMVLDENRLDLVSEVERELTGDRITCWTCGAETTREDIRDRLDQLREKITTIRAQNDSKRERVEKLEAKQERLRQSRRRRETLRTDIEQLEERLAGHQQSLADASERLEELDQQVETLSADVEEEIEQVTDVESEIKYRKTELQDAEHDLETLQERANQVEALKSTKTEIVTELEELRNRKISIQHETREAFDEAIQAILTRFDTGFETARLDSSFDIVVARDGREASLDALSEGELELLGIVAALAGHEAFDVHDLSPVLLIDQLGGLADDNLHTLIKYLEAKAEYLVFTAYPEHRSFQGHSIDPNHWDIVAHD